MKNAFLRNSLLIGDEAVEKLKKSSVAVFGVGGVGGFVVEGLARSGIGEITIFDNDTVDETNLNRQIIATTENIGKDKTLEAEKRVKSINPETKVHTHKVFYLPENADEFDLSIYDYIVDAVDTVSAKLEIIARAKKAGVPVISCMGTGGKTDITSLKVADIEKTSMCPLAKVMRRELKSRNISGVKAVYSTEETVKPKIDGKNKGVIPSMIFVPASAGLMIAREVVFDLIKNSENK